MRLQNLFKENLFLTSIIVVISGIIGFLVLWFLFPELVYDQFIWKYFWGPILADGLDMPMSYNGVSAAPKFTLVSEIMYGIVVAIALYGLYKLLKKWDITVNSHFFLGVLPFIIYGSVARVLEDAHLFTEPVVFWFVTPLIYIQTLVLALIALSFAYYIHQKKKVRQLSVAQIMGIIGIIVLLPFLYFVFLWVAGSPWNGSSGLFPNVFLLVILLCILLTSGIYVLAKYLKPYWKDISIFSIPLNLGMIFGHQLDGIASYISIYDPLNMGLPAYVEKHPASDLLMQIWPPLFPILKFFLIIGIIYVLDIVYKDELESQKIFVNLLKIGIFILGFAPGLRDLLRVAMGV